MNAPAIITENLSKSFGSHQVLHEVNLRVPENSIYGFIGANGAGKTTAIRILLGLSAATAGSATILGQQRGKLPSTPVPGVAYLPDVPAMNPWMKPAEALVFLGELSGVDRHVAIERAPELLDLVGLRRARGRIGGFSRGMKQRLGIAAALIGAPRLLIMDEPTSALDPLGRADVLAVLRELHGKATVLFSSHLLTDVQQVCTHIGMLDAGRLIAQGSLREILDLSAPGATATFALTMNTRQAETTARVVQNALDQAHLSATLQRQPATLQSIYEQLTRSQR